MARLLIGMWLLLIVSLSSMFFLMGDFLSERKHVEVSAPTERPYARVPRNSTDEASVGLAVIDVEEPAVPRAEPDEEPSARQLSEDDLESQPNLALSPNTEQTKQLKSVSVSAPRAESRRPGLQQESQTPWLAGATADRRSLREETAFQMSRGV